MSTTAQRIESALPFQCTVCHRSYAKKEHLQRHERSHTGHKPFACQICGRSFARQDALSRHERVHRRNASSAVPISVDTTLFEPSEFTPEQLQSQLENSLVSPLTTSDAVPQPQLQNSILFWPDSEHLLQNILSIDPALWGQPPTFVPPSQSHQSPPGLDPSQGCLHDGIDQGQRAIQTLSTLLSNTVNGITAPAALSNLTSRFLDSCLHMFFSTFVPMMPVIHRPTFVFQDCSPPLLLNAIAIGSLFLGSSEASDKGDALWRLAHTAVATSWHTMIKHQGEYDVAPGVQLVQTALLSQIYAALSKSRNLRITSQVFHGLGFYWARYCGLFDLPDLLAIPSLDDIAEIKYQSWRIWLARETQLRTLLGLYIIDGVISQYSGSPTVAQHMANQLPVPCAEEVYNATNPDEWLRCMLYSGKTQHRQRFCDLFRRFFYSPDDKNSSIPPSLSFFALKVILEGLKSLVAESKRIEPPPVGVPSQSEINVVLDRVREYIQAHPTLSSLERSTAMLRWHAVCLDALAITARGARRLCAGHGIVQHIFGGGRRIEKDISAERHINRDYARRTLLHACEIQRIASQLPLGLAHDPHVPGAVFAAATTFSAFALAGRTQMVFPETVDWHLAVLLASSDGDSRPNNTMPDANLAEPTNETTRFIHGRLAAQDGRGTVFRDLSYELSSIRLLLRALGLQWGVCEEMEEVVDAWVAKCT